MLQQIIKFVHEGAEGTEGYSVKDGLLFKDNRL